MLRTEADVIAYFTGIAALLFEFDKTLPTRDDPRLIARNGLGASAEVYASRKAPTSSHFDVFLVTHESDKWGPLEPGERPPEERLGQVSSGDMKEVAETIRRFLNSHPSERLQPK
jgi:hypothetical protein